MRDWTDREEWLNQFPVERSLRVEIEVGDYLVMGTIDMIADVEPGSSRVLRTYRWAEDLAVHPVLGDTYDYDAPLSGEALVGWLAEHPALAEQAWDCENERRWHERHWSAHYAL